MVDWLFKSSICMRQVFSFNIFAKISYLLCKKKATKTLLCVECHEK